MLLAVLIVLACLNVAVSDDYSPYPQASDGYQQQSGYPSKYGGSIYDVDYSGDNLKEIRALANNVSTLFQNNEDISKRATLFIDETALNNEFRQEFEGQLYPTIRERQERQTKAIAELEIQAEALLALSEDIANAGKSIDELRYQLDEILEEGNAIQQDVAELQKIEQDHDKQITDAVAQLTNQEGALADLEAESSAVSQKLSVIRTALAELVDVLRSEPNEIVTEVNVPSGGIVERQVITGSAHIIHYGISAIRIEDGSQTYVYKGAPAYGSNSYGYSPVINKPFVSFDVHVAFDADRKVLITSLIDQSSGGWSVTEVTVQSLISVFDEREISLEGLDDDYY